MTNPVISFSIPPTNTNALKYIKALKKHCKDTGMNFSVQACNAIVKHVKEMGIVND